MSLLNSLFNRGLLGARCKTCLNLAISRIKHLRNKRELQLRSMRKEIAQFLQTGQEAIARIRVEHIVREMNTLAAYEILELFCEFVFARVPILETQKDCPPELQEAIASIIFAAPRCLDLPELMQVRNLFTTKYGKEFVLAASELRPDSCVNRGVIEKLSVKAPSAVVKLKLLKDIAREYDIEWDSSGVEAEFNKKHEDLLDGSKQINSRVADLRLSATQSPDCVAQSNDGHPNQAIDKRVEVAPKAVPATLSSSTSGALHTSGSVVAASPRDGSSQPGDVLERARAAIDAAEKASAAARAAAELVNSMSQNSKIHRVKSGGSG